MIKLIVDQEYDISPQVYSPLAGIKPDDVTHYLGFAHMAFEDGSLSIYSQVWDRNKSNETIDKTRKACLILSLQDEQINFNNITSEFNLNYGIRACGLNNQVVMLSNTDRIALYSNKGMDKAKTINVQNSVSDAKYASQSCFLRSHNGLIAVPLHNIMGSQQLAFLKVENDPFRATWQPWPVQQEISNSSNTNILNLFLKKGSKKITPVYHQYNIEQALLKDDDVIIYTHAGSSKYGYYHNDLSNIGQDGEILEHRFYEDLRSYDDQKKRGKDVFFTSSTKFCVLNSHYKATDEWNGKQKLLDLNNNALVEFTLPRGYTKFRMVDHHGDFFWFQLENRKNCRTRIIRCRIKA